MTTLNLILDKTKHDERTTAINVHYLLYQNNDTYVLLDMRDKLNLLKRLSGHRAICFPADWRPRAVHKNRLNRVTLPTGDIKWESPAFESLPTWGKEGEWEVKIKLRGLNIEVTGKDVEGYELVGYRVTTSRTNTKKGS